MSKFENFPKDESDTKFGECTHKDFNILGNELINTINSANLTPSMNEEDQMAKSIANYVAKGNFYDDVTTDYGHILLSVKTPFKAPNIYYDGMVVIFLSKGNNLSNATINVNGLGEKSIRESVSQEGLLEGSIKQNEYTQLIFNSTLDSFIVLKMNANNNSSGGSLPILSIFYSPVQLDDYRLHLLNGDTLPAEGFYEDFYNKIKSIYDSGTSSKLFITQEEYQQQIANNGNCANFVFEEGVGVRLPTINGWIKGITSIDDLGTLSAELPNIKGDLQGNAYNMSMGADNSAIWTDEVFDSDYGESNGNHLTKALHFNASRSSKIYKDKARVQPDGVAYFAYIVVGNGIEENINVIKDYEVYNTIPLGCPIYLDHMVEDVNYILSDNTWKDGLMYQSLYELLLSQYNSGTDTTKQFGDYSITFKKTPLDYSIVLLDETNTEELINNIYNKYKSTFWVLDTTNSRFKVPQNTKRELIESYDDNAGNGYKLYSDGWCQQYGILFKGSGISSGSRWTQEINFLKPMSNSKYLSNVYVISNNDEDSTGAEISSYSFTNSSFTFDFYNRNSNTTITSGVGVSWFIEGYANLPDTFNATKYLYYKAGNTTVNAEIINVDRLITEVDKRTLKDGSNLTKGFQFVNSFDIQSGDIEIDINNLNDGARHIIYINNLITTNFVDNNTPYIQLGTDEVADSSNIYNYLIFQQLTNDKNNAFFTGNPSATMFNISYNLNDNMTNKYDKYIIELSSFSENYITIFVKRYMINNQNYLRYIEGKCVVENNNFNFLKFSSTLVSSNPFQTGSVKHYRIL